MVGMLFPKNEHTDRPEERTRLAFVAAWVSIIGNIGLAAVKVMLGLMLNSISLLADAAHTAADVLTSVVVVVGFRAAAKPADRGHPFGHGRAETVAGFAIAVLLGVTALQFMTSSVTRLVNPPEVGSSWWAIGIMVVFAGLKEWMARFAYRIADNINSETVRADGWHHRSDAIASLLVVVALVGAKFGVGRLDAVFGLLVAGLIGYVAYGLGKEAASTLVGKDAPTEFKDEVRDVAMTVTGVLGVHGVTVHEYGAQKAIGVHVETPPDLPVLEAHEVASRVEERLAKNLGASVVVHVEPARGMEPSPARLKVEEAIATAVREVEGVVGYHAVNVHESGGTGHIDLHVTTEGSRVLSAAHEMGHQLKAKIERELTGFVVNVHVEPCEPHGPGREAEEGGKSAV